MKFRQKLMTIEAFQLTQDARVAIPSWPAWAIEAWDRCRYNANALSPVVGSMALDLTNSTGRIHRVELDDWIVRDAVGELAVYSPAVFASRYEAAE